MKEAPELYQMYAKSKLESNAFKTAYDFLESILSQIITDKNELKKQLLKIKGKLFLKTNLPKKLKEEL